MAEHTDERTIEELQRDELRERIQWLVTSGLKEAAAHDQIERERQQRKWFARARAAALREELRVHRTYAGAEDANGEPCTPDSWQAREHYSRIRLREWLDSNPDVFSDEERAAPL